jgi:phage terminase Nu1 subunit (DNA packaging protein)
MARKGTLREQQTFLVPAALLMNVLQLSQPRISNLSSDGIVVRAQRGLYDLCATVRNYISYIRDGSHVDEAHEGDSETGMTEPEAKRLNIIKKNQLLDLQIAKEKGISIDRAIVHENAIRAASLLSAEIASLMNDMPGQLAGADEVVIRERLGSRMDAVLQSFKEAIDKAAEAPE